MQIGPTTQFSQQLHAAKYRDEGETFDDYCVRYASATADNKRHFRHLLGALREQRLLPAGRQQLAVGRPYQITAMNCYVGGPIEDSSEGIMEELKRSMLTMRAGGGDGWDFSSIRPSGDPIRGLGFRAYASGPISFMKMWDSMCECVQSAGARRGAMMAVLRVDHPDIMRFLNAKTDQTSLTSFNISVAITDSFMDALESDANYDLLFEGKTHDKVKAKEVWARIMERNWDWAEPGVIFIDKINQMNPLFYCEEIAATNPCAEQPLPPNGCCLLGSMNITKYIVPNFKARPERAPLVAPVLEMVDKLGTVRELDMDLLREDIIAAVRAFDNVIDSTFYPLPEQREEQMRKRRMGLGVTGMANALEVMGLPYASREYLAMQDKILSFIRDTAYQTSIDLAKEKEPFPFFDAERWLSSGFAQSLPDKIRHGIDKHGLRNGLLLSIAPTGTISLAADNVSSGIEPPFSLREDRIVQMPLGPQSVTLEDWALSEHGIKCRQASDVSPAEHISVLCHAQRYIDSSVSKTCNVSGGDMPGETSFDDFKKLYDMAYKGGAKGCSTFNVNGKRSGIRQAVDTSVVGCEYIPETGQRICVE